MSDTGVQDTIDNVFKYFNSNVERLKDRGSDIEIRLELANHLSIMIENLEMMTEPDSDDEFASDISLDESDSEKLAGKLTNGLRQELEEGRLHNVIKNFKAQKPFIEHQGETIINHGSEVFIKSEAEDQIWDNFFDELGFESLFESDGVATEGKAIKDKLTAYFNENIDMLEKPESPIKERLRLLGSLPIIIKCLSNIFVAGALAYDPEDEDIEDEKKAAEDVMEFLKQNLQEGELSKSFKKLQKTLSENKVRIREEASEVIYEEFFDETGMGSLLDEGKLSTANAAATAAVSTAQFAHGGAAQPSVAPAVPVGQLALKVWRRAPAEVKPGRVVLEMSSMGYRMSAAGPEADLPFRGVEEGGAAAKISKGNDSSCAVQ